MDPDITSRTFDGIEFVDTRIDHNTTGFDVIPKALAAAYGTAAGPSLPLDEQVGELVRLLVAVNSRCSYCAILHAAEARRLGIAAVKVDAVAAWRVSSHFTPQEVAAFAYTEALSELRVADIDAAHRTLRQHFDEAAIEALAMVIVNSDLWARLFFARGYTPRVAE